MQAILKKFSTARRVFQTRGVSGITQVLAEKAGAWWRTGEVWEAGKLVGVYSGIVRLDGCKFALDNPVITTDLRQLLMSGQYEKPERIAVRRFLNPELPVVEFGACMGVVSCVTNKRLIRPGMHVVVEANPDLLPLIEENRDRNGCHFTILHRAVAYRSSEVSFYIGDDILASSAWQKAVRCESVPTITLRDTLEKFGFERCTLICDIEGGEIDLVRFEADTLRNRITTLIMEVHDRLVGSELAAGMIARLKRAGFDIVYKNWDTYVFQNTRIEAAQTGGVFSREECIFGGSQGKGVGKAVGDPQP